MSTKLNGVSEFPEKELHLNHQTKEVDTKE